MSGKIDSFMTENRLRIFRWFFYISVLQLLAFFVGPVVIFPGRLLLHVELISAITLGLIVGLFLLLVNVCGYVLDRARRLLHVVMMIFVGLWFTWAAITWLYIEHMDYILR